MMLPRIVLVNRSVPFISEMLKPPNEILETFNDERRDPKCGQEASFPSLRHPYEE